MYKLLKCVREENHRQANDYNAIVRVIFGGCCYCVYSTYECECFFYDIFKLIQAEMSGKTLFPLNGFSPLALVEAFLATLENLCFRRRPICDFS